MRSVQRNRIEEQLKSIGFRKCRHGKGGHDLWEDAQGRSVQTSARRNDVPIAYVDALGTELEVKGIMARALFVKLTRGRGR